MLEEGEKWIDLKALVINCMAEFVEGNDVRAKATEIT